MVFETVLVDILNRFLSPYVKNLDSSQIQVSVWSGDIRLDNLEIKENALEQFEIPVRVHFGFLDKFRAKIPWKNLYNEPTIVEIDGLYIIAGPNSAFKFDPTKAEEEARNKKQRELEKFKRLKKNKKQKKEKQEEAQDQSFTEKVVTQVIKNLQVTIKNIHIRYEDTHTIPGKVFAAGVSLSELIMHSVDGNWQLGGTASDSANSIIYKLFDLKCLALYWNVISQSYYLINNKKEDLLNVLKTDIADVSRLPTNLQYILMPVSANAKVQIDTKAGQDINIPQALVNIQVNELNLNISIEQYRQVLSLLEEFDRLSRNKPYAKFRPEVPLKKHSKEWWNYAINSVLSEIRPKTREFTWEHIKHHREMCRRYIAKYEKKLLSTTSNPERSKTIAMLEKELDVFNILLCREIAEERAAKYKKQKALKKEQSKSTWSSWLGWGGSGKSKSRDDDVIIGDINLGSAGELDEEKKKFYQAIGYSEGTVPGKINALPKEYVAYKLNFHMSKLILNLRDQNEGIAKLTTDNFITNANYRPTAKGLNFHTEFSSVVISGCRRGTQRPIILRNTSSMRTSTNVQRPLFALNFEMNPLNSKLDFRIGASLQPIEVVYDAKTIDSIIGMFIIPPEIHLLDLRKAALATVEDIRTMSRAGLQFAIQNRTIIEIEVDIQAPYFIVPEKGEYMPDTHKMLIFDLGCLHITSDTQDALSLDVNTATQEQLESAFYDKFNVRLDNLQALVAAPGQDWAKARLQYDDLKLHLIKPTGFELAVSKSLIPNDTRLPNLKVNGIIKALELTLSDRKIQSLTEIILSLPLPPPSLIDHATQVATMSPPIQAAHIQREDEFDNLYQNLNLKSANDIFISAEELDETSDFFDAKSLDSSSDTASITTVSSTTSSDTFGTDEPQLPTYIKVCYVSKYWYSFLSQVAMFL
ncbi:Vacuolar protein sorting-associated protein 13C-like [Oopsacas minuta]|uniref:Vacuolar protein sorting-associated protein 13C-like n=1 Tax=Oopsacas minuta TaxID=111878 RepID=A0AAV7JWK1_9METZ|nr:Vacuolar protein sorting-associated protein 13C-like [Oopsacas minuta]